MEHKLPRPAKILFYNHTGKVSGAEKVLFSILSALDSDKYLGVVLAPFSREFESVCRANEVEFIPASQLQARYTLNPLKLVVYFRSVARLLLEIRHHIDRETPDVIHANTTRSAIIASLATVSTRIPVLWHVHDIMPRHPLSSVIRLIAILSGRNRIVAVSHATAEGFWGRFPKCLQSRVPIEVVHNGTDTSLFSMNREVADSFLQQVGLTAAHFRIGIVGQITGRKGHLELIHSLAPAFKTTMPNARLLVVGSAIFNNDIAYLELLKSEARRLELQEHVLFLGARDVPVVMKALNVLVLNSSCEPFGLVLTEAMASGTPVVAAAVGGVPEIIEDGISGLLFSAGDSKTLVSHLAALSTDAELVRRLVRAGRARVETLFDQVRFQAKILKLYERDSRALPRLGSPFTPPAN